MKKFLFKVFIFALYAFLLKVVFPVIVDPFNVFHAENIRNNGVGANGNYIKMKYIVNNPKKFDGFMFGSSRVGAIHTDKIPGAKIYNMTYSAGLPSENLANIKTFLLNNINPSQIFLGIDSFSYTEEIEDHIPEPMRCPYEVLHNDFRYFCSMYMNVSVIIQSLKPILFNKKSHSDIETFYKYGWWGQYGATSKFNWEQNTLEPSIGRRFSDKLLQNTVQDITDIVNLCREHKIKLTVFTNPMHNVTYMASVEKKYFEFLEGVAQATEFYNFSSLNDVTLNNDNFYETSHYKPEIGDMIMNVICNGAKYDGLYEQGFGVKVTRENASKFINMLREQAENFVKNKNLHGRI